MQETKSCYSCESNYAVGADGVCTSFTLDSNCRTLSGYLVVPADNVGVADTCHYCWDTYYWNETSCKLGSGLVMVSGLVMMVVQLFAGI